MITVLALTFVSVALLTFMVAQLGLSGDRQVKRALKHVSEYAAVQAGEAEPLIQPFPDRILKPIGRWLLGKARHLGPKAVRDDLKRQLLVAGNPARLRGEELLVVKSVSGFVILLAGLLLSLLFSFSFGLTVLVGMAGGLLGFFAPDFWLAHRASIRKRQIRRSLPDMLDMLTISVEAGLGFDSALAKLVSTTRGPLAEEFAGTLQEIQAGMSRKDALRALAERTDVPDLNTFIMSIIQAEVFGVSVNAILRGQAKEMRLKRRQHAEEVAQKAPVKMVFPVVLCILPATLLVVAGPAVISIARAFGFILSGGR